MSCLRTPAAIGPAVAALIAAAAAPAADLHVPAAFPTIQAAIDAASDGDVVVLAAGVFTGAGNVGVSVPGGLDVSVVGAGAGLTTINCAGAGRAFRILTTVLESREVTLSGLRVVGGVAGAGAPGGAAGGGVLVNAGIGASNRVTIENCRFQGCGAEQGGAVFASVGVDLTIAGTEFEGNATSVGAPDSNNGGAVSVVGPSVLEIDGCVFASNTADDGGAVSIDFETEAAVRGSSFRRNTALRSFGGGVSVSRGSSALVEACVFEENSAPVPGGLGGGLACWEGSAVTAVGTDFFRNLAGGQGGGLAVLQGDTGSGPSRVEGGVFEGNVALESGGGAFFRDFRAEIAETTFRENEASVFGGGIEYAFAAEGDLRAVTLENNRADLFGGGLAVSVGSAVVAEGCQISGNVAGARGGGVNVNLGSLFAATTSQIVGNTAGEFGGGLSADGIGGRTAVSVVDSAVSGNSVGNGAGGGVAIVDNAELLLRGTTVATNDGAFGGGLHVRGPGAAAMLEASTFGQNTAAFGGGVDVTNAAQVSVQGCTFDANDASSQGGGLVATFGSAVTISGSGFSGNSASAGGGIGVRESALELLAGSSLTGNNAANGGGLYGEDGAFIQIADAVIASNAAAFGGGVQLTESFAAITGTAFSQNNANAGGGIDVTQFSFAIVEGSSFEANSAGVGGGLVTGFGAFADVRDSVFTLNTALTGDGDGGAAYAAFGSFLDLVRCRISNNSALFAGGVGAESSPTFGTSALRLLSCVVDRNAATNAGGGVFMRLGSLLDMDGCLVAGNTSGVTQPGVAVASSQATITSSTIADNASTQQIATDAGLRVGGGGASLFLRNSIVAANGTPAQFFADAAAQVDAAYSAVPGAAGEGNIGAEPQFVSLLGADGLPRTGDEDYRLLPGSPGVDAGNAAALALDTVDLDGDGDVAERLPLDLDGGPRRTDEESTPDTGFGLPAVVDMGAYERPGALPCNEADVAAPLGELSFGDAIAFIAFFNAGVADVDLDGTVTFADVIRFIEAFNEGCPN